jgi:hypothetical protein
VASLICESLEKLKEEKTAFFWKNRFFLLLLKLLYRQKSEPTTTTLGVEKFDSRPQYLWLLYHFSVTRHSTDCQ